MYVIKQRKIMWCVCVWERERGSYTYELSVISANELWPRRWSGRKPRPIALVGN